MSDDRTTYWDGLLRVATQVLNDVLPFSHHRVYLRGPGGQSEGFWHFRTGFVQGQDCRWNLERNREACDRLLESGKAPVAGTRPDGRHECMTLLRLPEDWVGGLVVGREDKPFCADERYHLRLAGHLLQRAAHDTAAAALLQRLHLAFLDCRTELLTASSNHLLREYVDCKGGKACFVLFPDAFASGASGGRPGSHWVVRTTAKLARPNGTTLWIAAADSTRSEEWTDDKLGTRYDLSQVQSIAAHVFKTRRPHSTNDYQHDDLPSQRLFPDTVSHISAPILAGGGKPLGVLSVGTTRPDAFDDDAEAAFALLAAQAAWPLRPALDREQFARKKVETILVAATRRDLQLAADEEQVLQLLEHAFRNLEYERGLFCRVDYDCQEVVGLRSWGGRAMAEVCADTRRHFERDADDCQVLAVRDRKPVIVHNPREDRRANRVAHELGSLKAFGIFPLADSHGRVVRTVHVERRDTAPLGKIDEALVNELCRAAVEAWESAEHRRRELEWVEELIRSAFTARRELLEAFARFVTGSGLAVRCRVYEIDEQGRQAGYCQAGPHPAGGAGGPPFEAFTLDRRSDPNLDFLRQRPQPLVRSRSRRLKESRPRGEFTVYPIEEVPHEEYLQSQGVKEWVEAPVFVGQKLVAKVVLDHKGRANGRFTLGELRLVARLARTLSSELERIAGEELQFHFAMAGSAAGLLEHYVRGCIFRLIQFPTSASAAALRDHVTQRFHELGKLHAILHPRWAAEWVSLAEELELARELIRPDLAPFELEVAGPASDCLVPGQGRRLCLLLLTLLLNAIQSLRERSEAGEGLPRPGIRVRLEEDRSGELRIDVADYGLGVPSALAAELKKKPRLLGRGSEGRGMGLAGARLVAQMLHWKLELVQAQGPTTFRLTLPKEARRRTMPDAPTPAACVCILDADAPLSQLLAAEWGSERALRVLTFASPDDARQELQKPGAQPAVVVTDRIGVTPRSADNFVSWVRQQFPRARVLLHSNGYGPAEAAELAQRRMIDGYVPKGDRSLGETVARLYRGYAEGDADQVLLELLRYVTACRRPRARFALPAGGEARTAEEWLGEALAATPAGRAFLSHWADPVLASLRAYIDGECPNPEAEFFPDWPFEAPPAGDGATAAGPRGYLNIWDLYWEAVRGTMLGKEWARSWAQIGRGPGPERAGRPPHPSDAP